jgi:hypothetical protein
MGARIAPCAEEGFGAMSKSAPSAQQRKLRAIARRYTRDGYHVAAPAKGDALPEFLKGMAPDLIAESPQDHVVIEVKQASAIRGSNDLQEMAERVSHAPGWRFEFVAVTSPATAPEPARMEEIAARARQALDAGLPDVAYLYAWSILEALLNDLARQNGLTSTRTAPMQKLHDLAFRGIVGPDMLNAGRAALHMRNQLVHGETATQPSAEAVEELLSLGQTLRATLSASEAA